MKYIAILFLFLFASCGTTGHIVFYHFPQSKYEVQNDIFRIVTGSGHEVPAKWREHTEGDYFERIYVYFKEGPEELYQVGFTGDSTDWNAFSTSKLGLISIFQGKKFQYEEDLGAREKKRVQRRFETEILAKLKYGFYKTN